MKLEMEALHEEAAQHGEKVIAGLKSGMPPEEAMVRLQNWLDQKSLQSLESFAGLAEDLVDSTPFIEHEEVILEVSKIYDCIYKEKLAVREAALKRFHDISAEKKPEADLLAAAKKEKDHAKNECAKLILKIIRLKLTAGPPASAKKSK